MTTETLARLAGEVCRITEEAAALVLSMERPAVYEKEGHANFVTAADLASQEYLISHLAPLLPEASFFAEEGEHDGLPAGLCWLIDPIDGTTNFIRGARCSAISVGLVAGGEALLGVVRNLYTGEVFHAVRGGGAFADGEPIRAAATPIEKAIVMCGTTPTSVSWPARPLRRCSASSCTAAISGGAARPPSTCAASPRGGATDFTKRGFPPGILPPPRPSSGRRAA